MVRAKFHLPIRFRRRCVRIFVIVIMAVVFIETAPPQIAGVRQVQARLHPVLNTLGLWQGRWTLFAPNPKINNSWLSAEIYEPGGKLKEIWNSTYWAETKGWERFLGFRHINYNNRIHTINKQAADDFADYLARQLIAPTAHCVSPDTSTTTDGRWRIVLSRNELNISLPDDGTLPTRDETIWIVASKNLTVREYLP